jgi:Notch-like protein
MDMCNGHGNCSIDHDNYSYKCSCTNGWTGKDCSEDINECSTSPCKNNGVCADSHSRGDSTPGYVCTCTNEYTGDDCSKEKNPRETNNLCEHGV